MTGEAAILIWLPAGEAPQLPEFVASGATTYSSFKEALIAADMDHIGRSEHPWISTSTAIFSPEQIHVLLETLLDDETP